MTFRSVGSDVLEVVRTSTRCALKNNRALVQKFCFRAILNVRRKEIGVFGMESFNETFLRRVVH